jgi:hypothetical protein
MNLQVQPNSFFFFLISKPHTTCILMVLQNINNFWKWTKKKYEIAMGFATSYFFFIHFQKLLMFWSAIRMHVVCVMCVCTFEYFSRSTCSLQAACLTWLSYLITQYHRPQRQMGGWLVNRKGSRRKQLQSLLSYCSGNCMEGLRYTIKIFSETCWSPGHEMQ